MYKIAILDDNQDFCITLEYLLSNDFKTYFCTNTDIFLTEVESKKYDLIMVDFSIIPISSKKINNGCDLISYLKKVVLEPPILVLFTGWISNNNLEEGRKICPKADSFLSKDSGVEEILEAINGLLASKASKS